MVLELRNQVLQLKQQLIQDKKLKIALETDGSTDYSGLTIKGGRDFKGKVELCYLKDGREETTNDAGEANLIISEQQINQLLKGL